MPKSYSLKEWSEVLSGKYFGDGNLVPVEILTDSRDFVMRNTPVMFAAIRTATNDGHRYIGDLIRVGVKLFMVDDLRYVEAYKADAHFLWVSHVLTGLQAMAAYHRKNCHWPFLGITGSNGKTIVKEWLYHLLNPEINTFRSPRSYNSRLGVPLSILQIKKNYELSIIEAGISCRGEMACLEHMIQPDFGILTWFGEAHAEGFSTETEKWEEKISLFRNCQKALLHIPENRWHLFENHTPQKNNFITISEHSKADYRYDTAICHEKKILELTCPDHQTIELPLTHTDDASIRNLASCIAFIHSHYPRLLPGVLQKIPSLPVIQTRLDVTKGIQNSTLIHDYYSSDPDSLKIALNVLYKQAGKSKKKILILSEFDPSGVSNAAMEDFLENHLPSGVIEKTFLIGKFFKDSKLAEHPGYEVFGDTQEFLRKKNEWLHALSNAVVLIKGARKYALEQIVKEVTLKTHQTTLEIYPEKIRQNLNFFRSLIGEKTKIMAMVKAMGYGTGNTELALFLQQCGVNYLAVAFADEGAELRKSGIHLPIMVMNPEDEGWEMCIEHNLEPVIYSFSGLEKIKRFSYLLSAEDPLRIHIEFDTGMVRLGFKPSDASLLAQKIKELQGISVESVFSHFVASENPEHDAFSKKQWEALLQASEEMKNVLKRDFLIHICNTAGTIRFPWAHANMVRLGIGLYGIPACKFGNHALSFALRWKTHVSQIHFLEKNETVGYGRRFVSGENTRIATLPVGYADGFSRIYGNGNACLKIKGKYYPVVGNVCMDMCMVNVGRDAVEENDEAIIFENLEELQALCDKANTIPYEIISSISSRVKRVYVYE
ncbi:MAG: bifunctional UDP-N-acetylmuramoyl-tripeptide:D-alanyl-D-alanine ligase/alanine racemase [Bacteroidia bacterium]|nr:bifunctional UDP-N-acetylmuramoyl-tripeptide:D-alanyl-D-alanine ligase/alanine racemase [Bacteroidia bacterium]